MLNLFNKNFEIINYCETFYYIFQNKLKNVVTLKKIR